MRDVVLRGGAVLDGSGRPSFAADVLLRQGLIEEIGAFAVPDDAERLDCAGLIVAPGFIDAHSHSDLQVIEGREEKLKQGVTTEVVGNCGFSPFPCENREQLHQFGQGILCGRGDWGWRTAREYLEAAGRSRKVNVAPLAGHGSLRIAHVGLRQGPLSAREMDALECALSECLSDGAAGFSTGLMYAPGSSAPPEELERLCKVTARHGKVYATHMRDYFGRVVEAIEEQLELARRAGCRLQISHLQVAGRRNWPVQSKAIEAIEKARGEGLDVAFDCYPYVAGSTVLTQALPQWTLEGGLPALIARLRKPEIRQQIAQETVDALQWAWEDILISAAPRNVDLVGKSIRQIASGRGCEPIDAVLDLLVEEDGSVNMLCFNQSEENLRQTLSHPLSTIISDGFYVNGRPHPRLHGTFPKFLGEFVRDRKLLPLEEAVRKITSAPARRFGIAGRGEIRKGCRADICVFDPATVGSPATYDTPELPPTGIRAVIVNGELMHSTPMTGTPRFSS